MQKPKATANHPDKYSVRAWLKEQRGEARSKSVEDIKREVGWHMIKANQRNDEKR